MSERATNCQFQVGAFMFQAYPNLKVGPNTKQLTIKKPLGKIIAKFQSQEERPDDEDLKSDNARQEVVFSNNLDKGEDLDHVGS